MTTTSNVLEDPPARVTPPADSRVRISRYAALAYVALILISVLFGRILYRSVPFELASYSAWAGIFLALFAAFSLVSVPRWLGLRNRLQAAGLFVLGVAVTTTALMWPPAEGDLRSASHRRIDDFLPVYQNVEYHEARTNAPLAQVVQAMHQVSDLDMPGSVILTRLRALAHGEFLPQKVDPTPMFQAMARPGSGFLVLDDTNRAELVFGMVCRPWADEMPQGVNTPAEYLHFSTPGYVRIAFDFRVIQESASVVKITTETRILANNDSARKSFTWYWRLIYPGSAIIRRVILDAIIERAESMTVHHQP